MATKHVHEKRHITFQEYGALLAVREMLRRGDLLMSAKHKAATGGADDIGSASKGCHIFDMHQTGKKYGCGTVGCIGGMMAFIMGVKPDEYVNSVKRTAASAYIYPEPTASTAFKNLFYPPASDGNQHQWAWITPKIAVKAIDNFLETGKPAYKELRATAPKGKKRKVARKR